MSSVREAARALLDAIEDEASKGTIPTSVILAALAMRPALEADTVEVPREPTQAMMDAFCYAKLHERTGDRYVATGAGIVRIYRAMIAAASEPEAREGEG